MSPDSCRCNHRAFSLLEAVITLFLVSLVFLVAGDLLSSASRLIAFGQAKNSTLQAMQQAMVRMVSEVRESYQVTPSASEVDLVKVDASQSRFPAPSASPPASWDPYQYQLSVRYYVAQNQLLRDVGPISGTPTTELIADGISGLATQILPNGNLQISLSLLDDKVVKSVVSEVRMPAVP